MAKKKRPASRSSSTPTPTQPKPVAVNAMDLFRAQDAATKQALKHVTFDGFDNFVSRLGLNNDNSLSAGTYEFNLVTRNRIKLEAAYRGSWIVGAVVDSVAEDMTRAGVDVTTNEADADIKDFQSAISRKQIWSSVQNLIKWGRLYGGAIGVLQIRGQDLATPLDLETVSKGQFDGIAVYDRWALNPSLGTVIEAGPDMGLPKYYAIVSALNATEPNAPTPTGQINVHHSRVIRYTGIDLPYFQAITEMMWGESVLERLWDRLIAFDSVTMSTANLVERANNRTIGIEGLREIIAAGGAAQQGLLAQFEMMRSLQTNEGMTLLDKNDSFETTNYTFAGLSDVMLQFGQQLSGASGIPLVRLFGQSPAGLSATGDADIRMYYDNVNAQQEAKLRTPFDTLLRVLWRSTFGKPAPKDLEFTFTPLWQMSATDKANVAKTNTESVLGAFESGLTDRATSLKELRQTSGDTGLFSNISDEDIEEAEVEEPPMPDSPEVGGVPAEQKEQQTSQPPHTENEPKEPVKNLDAKPKGFLKRVFGR